MSDSQLSSRQMARLLKKFSIHEGDIVLVRKGRFDEREIMTLMKKGVEALNLKSVFVIIADGFDDLSVLNKQEMNSIGWYHVDQIRKLTGKI